LIESKARKRIITELLRLTHPPHFTYERIQYDLSHLQAAKFCLTIQAHGSNPELEIFIYLEFTNHCYTTGTPKVADTPHDLVDHNNWPRWFDPDRHETSLILPNFVRQLHKKKCFFTRNQNWLIIELQGESGSSIPFYLVFSAWKIKDQDNGLHLRIVSAYKKTEGENAPHRGSNLDRTSFAMLARKTLAGESVKRYRRR
jgi:hypothetical protein